MAPSRVDSWFALISFVRSQFVDSNLHMQSSHQLRIPLWTTPLTPNLVYCAIAVAWLNSGLTSFELTENPCRVLVCALHAYGSLFRSVSIHWLEFTLSLRLFRAKGRYIWPEKNLDRSYPKPRRKPSKSDSDEYFHISHSVVGGMSIQYVVP